MLGAEQWRSVQVLVNQPDGDAAAGELLDMLGFDHVDDVSRIVSHRPVRLVSAAMRSQRRALSKQAGSLLKLAPESHVAALACCMRPDFQCAWRP